MAGTAWPSLTAGQIARAADVESKFDWIEGSIVPMSAGVTTTGVHDLGTTTAVWRTIYANSLAGTSTANGIAIGTTSVANNSDVALEVSGIRSVLMPRLTTAQRTALAGINGMTVYDSTVGKFYGYQNGAWAVLGGALLQNKGIVSFTANGAASATVLNVASGGGKIHGISWKRAGVNGVISALSVILDGQNVYATTSSLGTTTAIGGFLTGDGTLINYVTNPGQTTTADQGIIATVSADVIAGGTGSFDFASTAAIYVSSTNNIKVDVVYSVTG